MRSEAEIGRGWYKKGTKGYEDCVNQTRRYEELAEAKIEQKQSEEAEKSLKR